MKKFIKVIEIILIVLAILCGVALLVGYIWFKDNTIQILNSIKDFINQPLPIVGVSILGFGLLAYEIVVRIKYGRKALNRYEIKANEKLKELEDKETNVEQVAQVVEQTLSEQDIKIDEIKGYLIELCSYSRNIKAHELAKRLGDDDNGEETKDSQTDEE